MQHNQLFLNILKKIRESFYSDEFLDQYRIARRFTKRRKLSMRQMVLFLFFHSKRNIDLKWEQLQDCLPDLEMPDVSKQAISKARQGVDFRLFQEIFCVTVENYYQNLYTRKKWKNKYPLFAIDGSDMEVPNSESNFKEFGKQSSKKNSEVVWSMALSSTLYDVLEDKVVDATLQYQFIAERELAVLHLSRLADLGLEKGSVVIFDRGYYSADVFQECVNTGCFCLMRLKESYTSLTQLEGDDVKTTITAPDRTLLEARVIKVLLSDGSAEYLVTNLMDPDITPEEFKELYFERWKIETKYYELKEFWKIEEFTGKTATSAKQDFFVTLAHANLASIIKAGADKAIVKDTKAKNIYQYQARRTFIIGRIPVLVIQWITGGCSVEDVNKLIKKASKKRSPVQPGRSRPRSIRTARAKKHYNNRKITF